MFGPKTKKKKKLYFLTSLAIEREIHVMINLIGTTNVLSFH